jgi:hypothetical protein
MRQPPTLEQLARQVRALRLYAIVTTVALSAVILAALSPGGQPSRFTEISAERINVISPDGRYAVVISNAERMAGQIMNGKERREGRRGAGLLFYNADGNEAGGMVFDSERADTSVRAFGQLSLDRFESDQVVTVRYLESLAGWNAGLQVSHFPRHNVAEWHAARDTIDRLPTPARRDSALRELRRRFVREGKWEVQRLFAGERGRTAVIELNDTKGRQRARLVVDSLDVARLEFLDERGVVVHRVPNR